MNLTTHQKIIALFIVGYIVYFGLQYVTALNFEFIAYVFLEVVIFGVLFATLRLTKFPNYIVWGLSIWGLLHLMGGVIPVGDGVLYQYRIHTFFDGGGDFYILKFDQVVHAFLYGVVGLMFLHLLREFLGVKKYPVLIAVIAIMASLGVSSINEILEFTAVVILPSTGVGGYENTLLDMVFNLGGAIVTVVGYLLFQKLKRNG